MSGLGNHQPVKLSPELIEKLDHYAPSPEQNASKVYQLLRENHPTLTNYELLCYCIEQISAAVLTQELNYMEREVKEVAKLFYYAHYYRLSCHLESELTISDSLKEDLTKSLREK